MLFADPSTWWSDITPRKWQEEAYDELWAMLDSAEK